MEDEIEEAARREASNETFQFALCYLFVVAVFDLVSHWGEAGRFSTAIVMYFILFLAWWRKKRSYMKKCMEGSGEKVPLGLSDAVELSLAIVPYVIWTALELAWTLG